MSIYQLKPAFQNLLRPLVKRLEQRGITANQVTLFACGLSLILGAILTLFASISELFYLLPIWLFLRMALNAMDGMLAREFNQKSALGGYLNEITDVVADAALYLPFAFVSPFSAESVIAFIFLAMMTEFCGVLGQVHGNGRRYDGPLGKSDRAFLIGALGLAYAYFSELPTYLSWLFWLANLALILTAYRRVKQGLDISEEGK
ncbi:CDP-alcohol phosphatidyltransferase [Haemophilus sputorum HK 2154]|uniref:CDP-alcohol phosphatidyltransferase family protein n=1 Tax=Haemophilus sputorum TaxID=1078480 RepID=UPI00024894B7|nr:CDP-alcohol phosphatidyltransferase family protein [Haemophilus sputorum]EJP28254.1 CDP-alcohol phosphatidyltransferase [Haemophilus sputorum HK 2154]